MDDMNFDFKNINVPPVQPGPPPVLPSNVNRDSLPPTMPAVVPSVQPPQIPMDDLIVPGMQSRNPFNEVVNDFTVPGYNPQLTGIVDQDFEKICEEIRKGL